MSPSLLWIALAGIPLVGLTLASPGSRAVATTWSGAGCAHRTTPSSPCTVRHPLLGEIDPALRAWTSPAGWKFAWLRNVAYLEAWSRVMDHDLATFMEARPATNFAFGIVDEQGRPRASFVLEWASLRPGVHTWTIQFAQGPGSSPVDRATFLALSDFGAWLGLDCIPLAG